MYIRLLLCYVCLLCNGVIAAQSGLELWYAAPANSRTPDSPNAWDDDAEWLKALPIGNGSLGAMVFGDVPQERVQLNEKTLWSGSPADNDNPEAAQWLDSIRQLLFAGKFREATELTNRTQVCKGEGSGHGQGANVPFGCFQTLGDLFIDFSDTTAYRAYRRSLDLETAIAKVQYEQQGIHFQREYFVSAPAQALVIHLTADQAGKIDFTARLQRSERANVSAMEGGLYMSGTLDNGRGGEGMQYAVRLQVRQKGGVQRIIDGKLQVQHADAVTLLLCAATNYRPEYPAYKGEHPAASVAATLRKALKASYTALRKAHIADYQQYFKRVSLELASGNTKDIPTDERLKALATNPDDPYMAQLYFQYGRYLLISSARPNTLPANLQGIWANKIQTAWNADYHTNINVQMNYWPAEVCNLSDIHLSLIHFIEALEAPATRSAKVQFGMRGWCINPITNVWGFTSPGEHPSWGLTSGAGGWICQHLWEHYLFTLDKTYLGRAYPVLKNAARFYMDWLVEDPETGKLVSGPASSPENAFFAPDGSRGSISMGPSHDQQIISELFGNVLEAGRIMGDMDTLLQQIAAARARLLSTGIGPDGRLMEWAKPYGEPEPGHRHMSHLYALHPGNAFNRKTTPEYVAAARKSLEYRLAHGGGHTGWSAAWTSLFWARLQEGDKALAAIHDILLHKTAPNLFDLHPPFQIDGNFGATAGIAEMLLQSHTGAIEILPALPTAWPNGRVHGLKARGNYTVDIQWANGKAQEVRVQCPRNSTVTLEYQGKQTTLTLKKGRWSVWRPIG